MATVDDLNVPPPLPAASGRTESDVHSGKRVRTYRARVTDATPSSTGKVRVLLDGTSTTASLRATAKAVRTGDNVEVVKSGGAWHVVGSDTWHEPPPVSGSMGTPPAAASTVSGASTIRSTTVGPAVSAPTNSTNAALYTFAQIAAQRITQLRAAYLNLRADVDSLNSRVASIQQALNTNASRLNQTRDYASNAGQLVEPVVGALRDEGIVR